MGNSKFKPLPVRSKNVVARILRMKMRANAGYRERDCNIGNLMLDARLYIVYA